MKKNLLIAAGVAVIALPVSAQRLNKGYVTWPESYYLHTYVQQWQGGNGTINIGGSAWEDENFFVSRVKPKKRFYNNATQVYSNITQYDAQTNPNGNDKRLIYWVPIGEHARNDVQLNSLADGIFDGEVFNMWSYVDHWGDWTSPYGWVPGNFADVAHKNGVAVSGVASVPESMSANWQNCLEGVISVGKDALGKWLYYHGVDGLGYNSEWTNGWAPQAKGLTALHNGLYDYMKDRDPVFENIWYGGVLDRGVRSFDVGITGSTEIYKGASMFLNYNWNKTSTIIQTAINTSKSAGKSPFYIYAGMNMQGGEPKTGDNYNMLKDYQYSIGLWGAHSVNMLWQSRNSNGSSEEAKIKTYIKSVEQWFGNGPRNPAIKIAPTTNRTHRPTDNWAGMSSMMSARSSLSWNLKEEPFYTFFNIGNGHFFNWKGERQNNNSWHNIGVQDYQPTWHYWFAPTLCGTDLKPADVSLNADVTWEDAFVGGSCLKVTGSTKEEYLHLFKTQFNIEKDYELVVSYRLIDGSANVGFAFSSSDKPAENASAGKFDLFTAEKSEAVADKCYAEGWQTVKFPMSSLCGARNFDLGMIALKITDAKDLNLLLGQVSIRPTTSFSKPETPKLNVARKMAYNISGVDAKLIWEMPNTKQKGEPCYNIDVKTSMFQLWAQQKDEEPIMMGLTTSWAGFVFGAPVKQDGTQEMRFGVSALSLDTETRGEIQWSDYFKLNDYVTIDDIQIDKNVIKPKQKFTMSFVDQKHESATWTITDGSGKQVWTKDGVEVECTEGIADIGGYNLTLKYGSVTKEYPYYITISSEDAGALPEIYSISIDEDNVTDSDEPVEITVNEEKTFSYTGRKADGASSRGVNLNENWFGVACAELGLKANQSFTVAAWVRYDELPAGRSNFITIEDRITGGWPYNNWGYFWSRVTENGKFVDDVIDTTWGWRTEGTNTEGGRIFYRYDDAKIEVGAWTHVAIVFDYENGSNKMRSDFYINGKKQTVSEWLAGNKGRIEGVIGDWTKLSNAKNVATNYGTGEPDYIAHSYPVTYKPMWIAFGGTSQNISAVKGCVDDFQVWGKAMTAEEIKQSMEGLDKTKLPADVIGFWDFEEPDQDNTFVGVAGSKASNQAPKAYLYFIPSGGENDNTRQLAPAEYLIGSPFIAGKAFPVVTKPTWETRRAKITETEGNSDQEGSAKISWAKGGDYSVRLHLANGHGEATMDYPVIKVDDPNSVVDGIADSNDFTTYTIDEAVYVEFAASGNYDVEIYNMDGALVGKKDVSVTAGQCVSVALRAPGVYLVKVVRDGSLLRTVKVIRK